MHEKLVQGLGHAREKYGKLLVQWGVSCDILARSREQMVARRGLDCWWFNNCLNGEWAHLCKRFQAYQVAKLVVQLMRRAQSYYDAAISLGMSAAKARGVKSLIEDTAVKRRTIGKKERERKAEQTVVQKRVQAQEWERDGVWSYDDDCDGNNYCDWVNGERPAEVRLKVRNMVVQKNSKKKADVAKEENGERLIEVRWPRCGAHGHHSEPSLYCVWSCYL